MRFLISLLALGLVWPAAAQIVSPLPTETDLKAAYCIPVFIDRETRIKPFTEGTVPAGVRDWAMKSTDEIRRSLRRTRLFLMPRMAYLDAAALYGANRSAQDDLLVGYRAVDACLGACKEQSCLADCQTIPEMVRLNSCLGANFLPF